MRVHPARFEERGIIHRALETRAFAFFDRLTMATPPPLFFNGGDQSYACTSCTRMHVEANTFVRFVYGWKYFETFSCVVRVRRWMKWYFERSNVRWQIGFNFVMIGFLFARLFAISFYV